MGDSDRKYRQRGYQESSTGGRSDRDRKPRGPVERLGPKPPQMVPTRTISRCAECGAVLAAAAAPESVCGGCGAAIRACTQCSFFDPGGRFQCSKPIPRAVPDKRARNDCALFELRVTFERDASSTPTRAGDPRSSLDALFKK
jgi:hypothetical protein